MDGAGGPRMSKAEVTVAWPESETRFLHPDLQPSLTPSPQQQRGCGIFGYSWWTDPELRQKNAPPAEPWCLHNSYFPFFFFFFFFMTASCREGAESTPRWVASSSQDPIWAFGGSGTLLKGSLAVLWRCPGPCPVTSRPSGSWTLNPPLLSPIPYRLNYHHLVHLTMAYPAGMAWIYPSENVPHDSREACWLIEILGFIGLFQLRFVLKQKGVNPQGVKPT